MSIESDSAECKKILKDILKEMKENKELTEKIAKLLGVK